MGALLLTSAPALAAGTYSYQYLTPRSLGYAHADGTYISACDTHADNQGVLTEYKWSGGNGAIDGNGSDSGCGHTNAPGAITAYHVCLRYPGSATIQYREPWQAD
jgi:hypothetical protein